ncbi:DUF5702 domain-containing protein [Butyrivibrio sp. AE3009]|uniref:DUF5702 domain-containing protein n=1 Tax=Butyrivibrio sp. AE3009 TaxID=1280666 RepID=UPI0018C9F584|nr:DUF5702 domain-containing protein [Butyrivibrio sp. AE3009]
MLKASLKQSKQTPKSSPADGYLTVFLSLTIMIILSLILALYQGARVGAVKMKTECVADIAMNSCLAEYSRALYEQYGLLMVDMAYGTGTGSVQNLEEHLRFYADKNFERTTWGKVTGADTMLGMNCKEAKVTGFSLASDNNGAVLNRQILAYMESEPVEGLLSDVLKNMGELTGHGLDSTDVEAMAAANQAELDKVIPPVIINDKGKEEEIPIGNPADAVNSQKSLGPLALAIPDKNKISTAAVNLSSYASHRGLGHGTGLDESAPNAAKKLLLEQYYYEKCSRYGAELEKSLLKYQLEYMIYGKESDYENLKSMAYTLLFWREASNMLYLFTNQAKVGQAELLADTLAILLYMPDLRETLKYSILFAWTFAESISDLNILFSGGRVPLLKSDKTWRLSIVDMLLFRNFLNGGDLGEGLYYRDYLRIKLFMTDSGEKTKRLMDIIEMDVRKTAGNSAFRIDHCVDIFRAEITVGTKYGYEAKVDKIYGYEE